MSYIFECQICGKKYDCCQTHIALNGWKNITCSHECYQEYLRRYVLKEEVVEEKEIVEVKTKK